MKKIKNKKKKAVTKRGLQIRMGRMKSLLWYCYVLVKDIVGAEGDDFLTGEETCVGLTRSFTKEELQKLKIKIRKYFKK